MKRFLSIALRVLVTAGFIAFAVSMIQFGELSRILGRVRPGPLALSGLLLGVPIFIISLRWRMLLAANGFDVPLKRVALMNYAGTFFNAFLPGAVGGDLAKAWLASRTEDRKVAVAGTVLLDRLVGLVAMIVMAAVAMIPVAGNPALRTPVLIIAGLVAASIVGGALYMSRFVRDSSMGRWLKRWMPFATVMKELDSVMMSVKQHPGVLLETLLLSTLSQTVSILAIYGISRALRMESPTLGEFFLFQPILFIVTAVPVSPGGWGVQESAYALLFGTVGVPANEAVALSVVYKACQIVISLPAGVVVLLGRRHRKESPQSRGGAESAS